MSDKHPIQLPAEAGAIQVEQRGLLLGEEVLWAEPGSAGYQCRVPAPWNGGQGILLGSEQRGNGTTLISFAVASDMRNLELAKLGVDPDEQLELKIVTRTVVIATTEYTEL